MSFDTISHTLTAAVASGGTFTVSYPAGRDAGDYQGAVGHVLIANQTVFNSPDSFTLSFGASNITVTYNGATTLADDLPVRLQLERQGESDGVPVDVADPDKMALAPLVLVNLGAPDTADADGVCASQSIAAAGVINGALASGGVATFDVPRNIVAAWTTTAVMTVTGTDVDGNTLVESSASGTTMAGKKAFKTVTAVAVSTAVTVATVGTGDVLGLPVFLPGTGHVLKELQDGAAATAGTAVAGATADPTATTGDVRGTYDPNSACNGALKFQLLLALPDPAYKGLSQYAG